MVGVDYDTIVGLVSIPFVVSLADITDVVDGMIDVNDVVVTCVVVVSKRVNVCGSFVLEEYCVRLGFRGVVYVDVDLDLEGRLPVRLTNISVFEIYKMHTHKYRTEQNRTRYLFQLKHIYTAHRCKQNIYT